MQQESHDLSNRERRQKERRVWRIAFGVSVLAHLLVFLLWTGDVDLDSPFAAAGPRAGDNRAARGGLQAMNIRTPPPLPTNPTPVPVPTLTDVEPPEFEESQEDVASVLGDRPGTEGPGTETGEGEGDGGTDETGRYTMVPPSPRGMIIPPADESLRGREVQVWVFVNESGRVVADSTRLRPPTPDRDFNRRLLQEAADWVFRPATQGGQPVAAWFPYTISM